MSNYLTTDTDLIAVADAIRAKGGTSSSLSFPDGYVSAIQDIQTGGNFEDITISQDYLTKQNTVISNGIIFQTDETYPGTPVVLNNTSNVNIPNGDLGQNGTGIKIELNRTYHYTGELKIEWSTGEQEIYSIDSDFTPTSYNSNVAFPNFSWEGIGISTQTFRYINLTFASADGYRPFMRLYADTQITKSGVLLDGSYYQISVTSNGFNTINLNLSDDPRFQAIYKSLAYRSVIASSAPGVSEWCNSLSEITLQQFAGQHFSGDFIFNNISSIGTYAFGSVYINVTGLGSTYNWNCSFPNCTKIEEGAFYHNRDIKKAYFPQCSSIGPYGFDGCRWLTNISFPICTTIGWAAFSSCNKLLEANFPNCITIGSYAFSSCQNLKVINFPNCTTIGSYAFITCISLSNINFPNCTTISNNVFQNCQTLTTISFPQCTSIGNYAFNICSSLLEASFPQCTFIGSYAFQNCRNLLSINFPNCTIINDNAFYNCYSLSNISFPNCTSINSSAFYNCSALTVISFPNCISLNQYVFRYCINLSSFYFMGSSIPSITNYTFTNTPLSLSSYLGYFGSIYVPASLLASYQTAQYWSQYSSRMVGI